jgi:hypothetical protein
VTASITRRTLLLSAAAVGAWRTSPLRAETAPPGELFRYSVGWRGFTGAYASLSVESPSPDVQRITADIENTAILRFIFRIRDRFQVLRSAQDGRTLKTFLWQNENGNRRYREETFLDDRVVSTEKHAAGERTQKVDVVRRPLDPLSALFWLRSQPLEVGHQPMTQVFANNRVFEARMHVREKEPVRAVGRTFDALRVTATFHREGREVDGVRGTFWISADPRRLPLKVQADTTYGPVSGTLTEFKAD